MIIVKFATHGARALLSAAVLIVAAGCTSLAPQAGTTTQTVRTTRTVTTLQTAPATPSTTARPTATGAAADLLATLAIKGRAAKTGYDRLQFGTAWTDDNDAPGGRNGCDTRNDVLGRDLLGPVFKLGTGDCVALSGTLHDPYTDRMISFVRGRSTSAQVQIDHVVALSDAWQKGAQLLGLEERIALANDPVELLAVDGATNQAKGDGDAATWLPPNKAFRCEYVARQVAVKSRYRLWVSAAEHDAIARVLNRCPGQPLPTGAPTHSAGAPAPSSSNTRTVEYSSCSAVRAAGAAPLLRGQPGYAAHLDGDGDGIACEN